MAQNFVQDGVTLQAPVVHDTKIYSGTPIFLATGGATAATATSGIDGISMNTCAHTADDNAYVYNMCVYRTEGVFMFKVDSGTTFTLGESAYIVSVDNSTAAGAVGDGEQEGARTLVTNLDGCSSTEKAIGTVVALGSIKALGTTTGTDWVQVKIVTLSNSNLVTHS